MAIDGSCKSNARGYQSAEIKGNSIRIVRGPRGWKLSQVTDIYTSICWEQNVQTRNHGWSVVCSFSCLVCGY